MVNLRLVLLVLVVDLLVFLAALDNTIMVTIMPTVIGSLGGLELYSWAFSSYLLASTVTVILFGKLSDLFGRRRLVIISVSIFIIGSLLGGLAADMTQLVVFRGIQGVGGGGTLVLAMIIFGYMFPPEKRGKVQGLVSSMWTIASIVGPLLGGIIVAILDWRWVFFLNIPLGVVALSFVVLIYKEAAVQKTNSPINYFSLTALTATSLLLLFTLLRLGQGVSILSTDVILPASLSVAAFILLLAYERRSKEPLIPPRLFRNRYYLISVILGFLSGMTLFGSISFIPLFIQGVQGRSATEAGLAVIPLSIGWSLASMSGGQLINRVGYRVLSVAGVSAMLIALSLTALLTADDSLFVALRNILVLGTGMGLIGVSTIVAIQNNIERSDLGIATSSSIFFRNIGGTIGVALLGSLLSFSVVQGLEASTSQLSFVQIERITDPALMSSLSKEDLIAARAVLSGALYIVFIASSIIAAIGVIISIFMPKGSPTRRG